jgi:DNA-binding GntR family transcriptional regulator
MDVVIGAAVGVPAIERRHSLRRQVADALRAALITGKMKPGVIYSAPALAVEFGVSPTPVREAMIDLVKDGLFEAVRNRGFRVVPLSAHDLEELIELRGMLEVSPVVKLAGAITAEAVAPLRALADEIVLAAERGDLPGYVDADRRFHAGLLALHGNQTLVGLTARLRNRARLYGMEYLGDPGRLATAAREHGELLDALLDGDAAGAEETIQRHLGHVHADHF